MDFDAWLETALPQLLPDFLPKQRWFGGKARPIQATEFEDAMWLAGARTPCALIVVGVRYADGARERYAMLLAFVDDPAGLPVVGPVDRPGPAMWAVEAATHPETALGLLRGFVSPRELPTLRGGRLGFGDASEATAHALADPWNGKAIRPVGTEQSNTSVCLDHTLVFKLFRKLDEGENPELEVGRFLTTRTTFRAMPMLRGSLTYVPPRGEPLTAGLLQDWIENRGDGWSHVVALLRQTDTTSREALLQDLFALGATTADFHAALATDTGDPAFAPEPATAADVEAWRAALLQRASSTLALVGRSLEGWPEDARRLGRSLLDVRARLTTVVRVPELGLTSAGFQKIRVHGDYHLGQTLKTDDGFVLIDFEGEPARPLAERRLKHCALKDVAGMIRSFDYAVETVRKERPHTPGDGLCALRLREWFLDGYLSSATLHHSAFLPEDRGALDAWIDFFELEKALYEVEYEINNRPSWVHIPLGGILRILHART